MKNLLLVLISLISFNVLAEERKNFIVEFHDEPLAVEFGKFFDTQTAIDKKNQVRSIHRQTVDKFSKELNKSIFDYPIKHEYFYAFNGVSLSLTKNEALSIQKLPEVKSISLEKFYTVNTDIGPQWIGADNVWDGMALDTPPNKGEGVVVGIIDTGINPSHPSFQEISEPGTANQYTHNNPKGRLFGLCNGTTCNNKLIGIYDFTDEETSGIDSVGHGSHVAGIAAGNVYKANYLGKFFTVSGVAPKANIISYKACSFSEESSGGSCSSSALLSSIDQATADLVDVVNYSIGSETPCSPWGDLDNNGSFCGKFGIGRAAAAMLNARSAGVTFVVSAGNSGPGKSTIGYPAVAPWVITAANTTHSRQLQSSIINFTGGDSSLEDLVGVSASIGIGPLKIVHAKNFGNALCGQGDPELKSECSGSGNDVLTGVSNPFSANTFNGEIVVCDRGTYGRIEKGFNVLQAGAAGYILANTVGQQESIVADNHCLPATHLGNEDGSKLRTWLDSGSNHKGEITGQTLVYDDSLGDILSSSSSRGPLEIVYNSQLSASSTRHPLNYMKPNLAAPGSSIFSSTKEGEGLTSKSGTSMSAPHISGAVALIKAAHPNYSPSQLASSLILTADNSHMLKEDKLTKADFSDQGAGRTRVDSAMGNSIYLDVSRQEFIDANPQNGGDVKQLNLPELVDDNCYPSCTFSRRVKLLNSYNVVNPVWNVSIEKANGLDISVTPASFDFNGSNEVALTINVNATANDVIGDWAEAKIVFTVNSKTNSNPMLDTLSPSESKIPLAVYVPAGNYPSSVDKQTSTRHGSFDIDLNNIASMTNATYVGLGFLTPTVNNVTLIQDNDDSPFEDDSEAAYDPTGSSFSLFEINTEKQAVIIESSSTGANPANLYVGKDLNINNTPDEFEIICTVKSTQKNKQCVLKDVKPGIYWVLVNNKSNNGQASITTETIIFDKSDTPKKADLLVNNDLVQGTGLYIKAPVTVASSTQLKVSYELPIETSQSGNYYGLIAVGADAESVGKTAVIPIKISVENLVDNKIYALNNEAVEFKPSNAKIHSNMYVDTGIGAEKIFIYSFGGGFKVSLYRTDFDFDPLSVKPDLSLVTPDITGTAGFPIKLSPNPPDYVPFPRVELNVENFEPGRWYVEIIPDNNTIAIQSDVHYKENELIQPNQSLWFNPSRSGWGIDLSQTNTFQAITWYTYNDDGTKPIWLLSSGPLTNQNQWRGDLTQVTWTGTSSKVEVVGSISMVYTSNSTGVISISTPDKNYTEKLVSIYSPSNNCAQVNGSEQLDITGLWYLLDQPGFGNTLLATETTETTAFYYFDELGLPTWIIGTREFNDSETIMNQASNGFCPDCEFSTIELNPVGTISNVFTTNSSGTTAANIQLLAPLSGDWQSAGDSIKLNRNFGCIINN